MEKLIPYGKQHLQEEDFLSVQETLRSDYLTSGPKVKEFEDKFAAYVGARYAVAIANGTAALHLACLAAGLKAGEELITSPMTFAASANCALYCQAKPVFVDIHQNTGLIDGNLIEEKINSKTKIILPVHYTGLPCEMEQIQQLAKKHNLIVIEDACHALGATYKESRIGNCKYSDMACFSFHPVKHITTGEGGMITTNSSELYEKLLMLRSHGITKDRERLVNKEEGSWYQEMHYLGFNYRITDIQCALGVSQLQRIDEFVERRRKLVKRYQEALREIPDVEVLEEPEGRFNSHHLFVIKLENVGIRRKVFDHLKQNSILAQVHYLPVYLHPYYQNLGYAKGICPNAEEFYDRIISLPLYYSLTNEEQEKVMMMVKEALKKEVVGMDTANAVKNNATGDVGVKKELNTFIFKYQKEDVNEKLGKILGEDFRKYRERFNKTQRYQETKFVPEFPLCLSLELVNRCNLNCVMCYKPHHSQPFAELSLETIQKIADECQKEGMPSLILGLGAETLIYPKVKEVLEMIRKAGVMDIFFGTNGVLLNDNIISALFENNISRVEISLDAATPETYKKVRGYDLLPRIEANIEKLLEAKKARNSPLPVIRLCFVVMDINKHETQLFIDKWKDKVDYIDFQRCVDFSEMDEPVRVSPEAMVSALKESFCSQPFYSLNIWGNGNVTPCCSFYGEKLVIGNIHQQSLKEIWEGEKMKVIREQILTKRFNPTCQKCLYFRDNENIEKSFQQK